MSYTLAAGDGIRRLQHAPEKTLRRAEAPERSERQRRTSPPAAPWTPSTPMSLSAAPTYIIGSLPGSARFMLLVRRHSRRQTVGMEQVAEAVMAALPEAFAQILLRSAPRREKQECSRSKILKDLTEEFPGNACSTLQNRRKAWRRPHPRLHRPGPNRVILRSR